MSVFNLSNKRKEIEELEALLVPINERIDELKIEKNNIHTKRCDKLASYINIKAKELGISDKTDIKFNLDRNLTHNNISISNEDTESYRSSEIGLTLMNYDPYSLFHNKGSINEFIRDEIKFEINVSSHRASVMDSQELDSMIFTGFLANEMKNIKESSFFNILLNSLEILDKKINEIIEVENTSYPHLRKITLIKNEIKEYEESVEIDSFNEMINNSVGEMFVSNTNQNIGVYFNEHSSHMQVAKVANKTVTFHIGYKAHNGDVILNDHKRVKKEDLIRKMKNIKIQDMSNVDVINHLL